MQVASQVNMKHGCKEGFLAFMMPWLFNYYDAMVI